MATKGYNSYHGRMSGGKIALIVALALVLEIGRASCRERV